MPLAGAVLVAINTRLAPEEVRYNCDHSQAKLLVVDSELRSIIDPLKDRFETIEEIVTVIDPGLERDTSEGSCDPRSTEHLERGSGAPLQWTVEDELATITIMQNDGYVRLMDRAKDVVVSAGENIATVEVEQAAVSHDAVAEAAVIGVPDEQWGERPKAFAVLAPGQQASKEEIIDHVRQLREAETAKQARPAEALAG